MANIRDFLHQQLVPVVAVAAAEQEHLITAQVLVVQAGKEVLVLAEAVQEEPVQQQYQAAQVAQGLYLLFMHMVNRLRLGSYNIKI
jgi:hypothetical protein